MDVRQSRRSCCGPSPWRQTAVAVAFVARCDRQHTDLARSLDTLRAQGLSGPKGGLAVGRRTADPWFFGGVSRRLMLAAAGDAHAAPGISVAVTASLSFRQPAGRAFRRSRRRAACRRPRPRLLQAKRATPGRPSCQTASTLSTAPSRGPRRELRRSWRRSARPNGRALWTPIRPTSSTRSDISSFSGRPR